MGIKALALQGDEQVTGPDGPAVGHHPRETGVVALTDGKQGLGHLVQGQHGRCPQAHSAASASRTSLKLCLTPWMSW